jgi:hypothetical protein
MSFFNKYIGVFELILLSFLGILFFFFTVTIPTDIRLHANFIIEYAQGLKNFPTNFLYYFTVYLFGFFSSNYKVLLVASIAVLSLITLYKYQIVKKIIVSELNTTDYKIASITSAVLLFVFALPSVLIFNNLYYLGSFTPNIWHNSTTIFVMPFVILLYWESCQQLLQFNSKRLWIISLLILINVCIKPSFLFVYLMVYPFFLLYKYRFSRTFFLSIIPIAIATFLILIEYLLIYKLAPPTAEKSGVGLELFKILKLYSTKAIVQNPFLLLLNSVFFSYFFPIVFLIKNKVQLKNTSVLFAVLNCVVSIVISQTLTETGDRASHGNFSWQTFMCSFLLFLICTIQLLKLIYSNHKLHLKSHRFELIALVLHFLSGFIYFIHTFITNKYV